MEDVTGGVSSLTYLISSHRQARTAKSGRVDEGGSGTVFIVHFWADWCEPCAHMDQVLEALVKKINGEDDVKKGGGLELVGLKCEAEEEDELSEVLGVEAVPTMIALRSNKNVQSDNCKKECPIDGIEELGRVEGASPADLSALVEKIASMEEYIVDDDENGEEKDLTSRIQSIISSQRVMLFMKGKPSEPRCGFSRKVADALVGCYTESNNGDVDKLFGSFDILQDQEIRQGLKEYSKWPTYPQLYVDNELVGGCDIVMEMHESGELQELIGNGKEMDLTSRIQSIISSQRVMLFMKGKPSEPRCGFSRKVADALVGCYTESNNGDVDKLFGSFDILQDQEIRQGLKEYSKWPTYPQLYVDNELVGGCDIVMEMHESGELQELISG